MEEVDVDVSRGELWENGMGTIERTTNYSELDWGQEGRGS